MLNAMITAALFAANAAQEAQGKINIILPPPAPLPEPGNWWADPLVITAAITVVGAIAVAYMKLKKKSEQN